MNIITKHTTGPWVWIEGTDAINHRWNNHDWTVASVGNHRLGWHEDKNSEGREAGANARLIAAAPELLAACNLFLEYEDAELEKSPTETFFAYIACKKAVYAAIAKATGAAA